MEEKFENDGRLGVVEECLGCRRMLGARLADALLAAREKHVNEWCLERRQATLCIQQSRKGFVALTERSVGGRRTVEGRQRKRGYQGRTLTGS